MRRITLALLLFSSPVLAATLECKVTGISDGDTLSCFDPERRTVERIRLRGIDAPEHKQAFGTRSRQNLSDLAYGKTATIHWTKRDRWNRIIGVAWVEPADCPGCGNTLDVGRAQLASGMAWWFRRYANEQPLEERLAYKFEENEARARSAGLWQDQDPIAPWDWRRKR